MALQGSAQGGLEPKDQKSLPNAHDTCFDASICPTISSFSDVDYVNNKPVSKKCVCAPSSAFNEFTEWDELPVAIASVFLSSAQI